MGYKFYKEAISAKNNKWKQEVRKLLENGSEFVVIHLKQEDFRDCKAIAQEFDYECIHEDEPARGQYPKIKPSKIGFIKRTSFQMKSD
jgi:hypothetical protein